MPSTWRLLLCVLVFVVVLFLAAAPSRADPQQFATPGEAVTALRSALAKDELDSLLRIFGREHAELVLGADPASGRVMRRRAAAAMREKIVLRHDGPTQVTLVLGRDAWAMPIPLVRREGAWSFDGNAGEQEILARRIGENELAAIDALKAFVEAQRRYAAARRARRESPEYARYVQSTAGDSDGLWWDKETAAKAGPSPLDGFAARNAEFLEGRRAGDPFRGYYFRILTGQGANASGGAMSYLEGSRMTKGFAMIAWPSDYRASGVETFMVGPDGRVLEKDFGEDTAALARTLLVYDPDASWRAAER